MHFSIRTAKSGTPGSPLERNLPAELWQIVAQYLSGRELQNAAFLHPSLSDLAKTFKYQEANIDFSFLAHSGHGSVARYSLKRLARLRSTGNAHHIQTLCTGHCHVSSAKRWILKAFGNRITYGLLFVNPWQASPSILRDFTGIKSLHVDASFINPWNTDKSNSPSGPQHPFMTWIWQHIGTQLTTVSLVVPPIMRILLHFFPDKTDLSGLLPTLQVMQLKLVYMNLGHSIQRWPLRQKAMSSIASIYVHSTTLKCLTIDGYNIEKSTLSILLPLEAETFPSLESLSFRETACYSRSFWSEPFAKFIALHSKKFKVLRLSGRLVYRPRQTARWLSSIPLPSLVTLELYTDMRLTLNEIHGILQPRGLIAKSLKCLALTLLAGCFSTTLTRVSTAAPHLKSLHIRDMGILSIPSVLLLARLFPNLCTLCLEFKEFSMNLLSTEVDTFMEDTSESSINDIGASKQGDLLKWKLFDISLFWTDHKEGTYYPSVHVGLLKALAARIPSIESFHGEGDKFGIFKSPIACPCLFREP
ncbi:hypothetical protein DL96DRAFT_1608353 [Flagelloscypha sp. PMI_526]|nr:hypothetical protein DL96DRAFT_1608353 [Flagelloscypha sp. PMI_526]